MIDNVFFYQRARTVRENKVNQCTPLLLRRESGEMNPKQTRSRVLNAQNVCVSVAGGYMPTQGKVGKGKCKENRPPTMTELHDADQPDRVNEPSDAHSISIIPVFDVTGLGIEGPEY